jgi:hypothetical protein
MEVRLDDTCAVDFAVDDDVRRDLAALFHRIEQR